MPDYQFIGDESDDYMDFLADAVFEVPLSPAQVPLLMQMIAETITRKAAKELLIEGLSTVQVNLESLTLKIRFSRGKTLIQPPNSDISRRQTQFVIYLFAKIDSYHRLGKIPFPPDFRMFLNLESEYGD